MGVHGTLHMPLEKIQVAKLRKADGAIHEFGLSAMNQSDRRFRWKKILFGLGVTNEKEMAISVLWKANV
ncbi:hypothetical protein CDAR_498561 [Caerostris darwini]|uniref:Uncharacterized protein n=1 Tax=Caerostris darwini TaxID=1538125 RepID=A0AAV4SNK8_9ARAC|nr:hypothetical protein CDAR_498561 [Caerostris darwini]